MKEKKAEHRILELQTMQKIIHDAVGDHMVEAIEDETRQNVVLEANDFKPTSIDVMIMGIIAKYGAMMGKQIIFVQGVNDKEEKKPKIWTPEK